MSYSERVLELSRMTRAQLLAEEERARGGRRIYGKPSRDEIISEILFAEKQAAAVAR